jgi:3-methyladenine DNA glycosylase/8-oxoguanine DNA glycosylase
MGAAHRRASYELASLDPVMASMLDRHGPMVTGRPVPVARRFESLARTIAHQQLAGRAAATIWSRVRLSVDGEFTPDAVARLDPAVLRQAGLSSAKVLAVMDLASRCLDGTLQLNRLGWMSEIDVVRTLSAVRGIGPWSAQMFLMHELSRLDIWPTGDLGVRSGYARAYRLPSVPSPSALAELGNRFRPYRSVAAWYCWRAADDPDQH